MNSMMLMSKYISRQCGEAIVILNTDIEIVNVNIPNLANCIALPRRSHDEFDDKLDVDGDGRRLSVLTKL